jgi:uncharacterized membrane protein HdeD (DUF308 family)
MIQPPFASQGRKHRTVWTWFLVLGLLLLVLGLAGAGAMAFLEVTLLLVFGPLLLASSLLQLLIGLFLEMGKEKLLHYLAAGLEMVLGFFIMANPLQTVGELIALIAVFLIVIGLARLGRALAGQSHRRGWIVMAGVVALLVGISVWIGRSVEPLWLVGLCIALDLISHGVSWSALALAERGTLPDMPTRIPVSPG